MTRFAIALAASVLVLGATRDAGAVPTTVTFTGRLTDAGGAVEGNVNLVFRLFDTSTGGIAVWQETHSLTANAGLVHAGLGTIDPSGNPLDEAVFAGGAMFLEVGVNGALMSPRTPIRSVPYAIHAATCDLLGTLAPDDVQLRVGGTCAAGSSIRAIGEDGSVVCEADDDAPYVEGFGIDIAPTTRTISVNTMEVQDRVSGGCTAGSAIRAIGEDGSVVCETDDDVPYVEGFGIDIAPMTRTVSVNTTDVQDRVSGTCAAGSSIRAIAADGSMVTCEADDGFTSAGAGLSASGATVSWDGRVGTGSFDAVTDAAVLCLSATSSPLISLTVPSGGTMIVSGHVTMLVDHNIPATRSEGYVSVSNTPTDCSLSNWGYRSYWTIPESWNTANNIAITLPLRRAFTVSAGTHNYYITGRVVGGGPAQFRRGNLDAIFIPN